MSIFSDIDFRDIAKESLRNFTLRHYYGEGEEFEDFIDHLSREFSTFDTVLFQVDITKSKSTLLKSFINLLDDLFIPYRDKDVLHKIYVIPTNPIYIDELKRYLMLYD